MSPSRPGVRVTTAAESAARDAAAIAAGTPSGALMQRAGEAAALVIRERYPRRLARGMLSANSCNRRHLDPARCTCAKFVKVPANAAGGVRPAMVLM